jgi:hypothetical protein
MLTVKTALPKKYYFSYKLLAGVKNLQLYMGVSVSLALPKMKKNENLY